MNTAATILTSLKNVDLFNDIYYPNDKTDKIYQKSPQLLNKDLIKEMETGLIEKAKTFDLNHSRFSKIDPDNLFGLSINDKIDPCLTKKSIPRTEFNRKKIMTIVCIVIAAIATAGFATLAIVFSAGIVPLVVFSVLAVVSGILLAIPSSLMGKINKEVKEDEKQKQNTIRKEKQILINDLADNFLPYLIQTKVIHRIASFYKSRSNSACSLGLNYTSEYIRKGILQRAEPFLTQIHTLISNGDDPEQAYLKTMNKIERAISLKDSLEKHPLRYKSIILPSWVDESRELLSLGNRYSDALNRYWTILDNWNSACQSSYAQQPLGLHYFPDLFLPRVEEVYNRLTPFSRESSNEYRSLRKLYSEGSSVLPELWIFDCRVLSDDINQVQTNIRSIDTRINRIDNYQSAMNDYFSFARQLDGCRQELIDELNNINRLSYARSEVDIDRIITKLHLIKVSLFPGRSFT